MARPLLFICIWFWELTGWQGPGVVRAQVSPIAFTQVTAGLAHSAGLTADGQLWLWGSNNLGQLGDGTTTDHAQPQVIFTPATAAANTTWTFIAAGGFHSAALRSDGTLWTWGANANGQLGDGSTTDRLRPAAVPTPPTAAAGTRWVGVALGDAFTLALRSDSTLWAWGANIKGQAGNNFALYDQLTPSRLETPTFAPARWVLFTAAPDFALATTADGTLWGWGHDQLGPLEGYSDFISAPRQVLLPLQHPAGGWAELAGGDGFSAVLSRQGRLWVSGDNASGQIGDGSPQPGGLHRAEVAPPAGARAGTYWTHISARGSHLLALRSDSTLWAWGENFEGQLGVNSTNNQARPVREFTQGRWTAISAGSSYALAQQPGGILYATGANEAGQAGNGTTQGSLVFHQPDQVLAARSAKPALAWQFWPNPAPEQVRITGLPSGCRWGLTNLMGQPVREAPAGATTLGVAGLAAGVYFVRVLVPGAGVQTSRLLVP